MQIIPYFYKFMTFPRGLTITKQALRIINPEHSRESVEGLFVSGDGAVVGVFGFEKGGVYGVDYCFLVGVDGELYIAY